MEATLPEILDEAQLLSTAINALQTALPAGWKVESLQQQPNRPGDPDMVLQVKDPSGSWAQVIVEARSSFAPRDVRTVLGGRLRLLDLMPIGTRVLVVAPWISPRSQQLLTEAGIDYLDLTGNARLEISRPGLFIYTTGAPNDPRPAHTEGSRLRGAKAGRVIRLLTDCRPPYTVVEIARASGVNIGYVSRLLETLEREALVERTKRGGVASVQWPDLLRRRGEVYGVFTSNDVQGYLAPQGAREAYSALRDLQDGRIAVTGSFGAVLKAPVAAPALLTVYTEQPTQLASALRLLPLDAGGDVVLVKPQDPVVYAGVQLVDGMPIAAPSQLALDCLTGSGRMPAEGEALLEWMKQNEPEWRSDHLPDAPVVMESGV